ncbi:MAG: diaminopimelate epimerase [Marinicella sp.]
MAKTYNFEKLHGLGNDFMLLDCRSDQFNASTAQIAEWANRRTGVGFDQLIVIEQQGDELKYRFFNADGGEAEQCGNGQRAIAYYLHHQGVEVNNLRLTGLGGEVHLHYVDEDQISVTFDQSVKVAEKNIAGIEGYYVDIGNPHWVYHEPQLTVHDLEPLSHLVANQFESGVNFEAIKKIDDHHIQLRVIERGVGETQACGSGACAAAIASATLLGTTTPLTVSMLGGDLRVSYDLADDKITLTGPARTVYTGQISLET